MPTRFIVAEWMISIDMVAPRIMAVFGHHAAIIPRLSSHARIV